MSFFVYYSHFGKKWRQKNGILMHFWINYCVDFIECQHQLSYSWHSTKLVTVEEGKHILPPATKLGQGYVFTGMCDSVHKGGSASVHAGMHPPGADTLPGPCPLGADTPPGTDTPPGADTPREQTPPRGDTPHSRHPPRSRHPPNSMLEDTVNARAVRILLECNLVCYCQ